MDACQSVERELDKVTNKFRGIEAHTSHTLQDLISHVNNIKQELAEAPEGTELSATQTLILTQSVKKIKDTVARLGQEHKDLHGSVSKVGRAIDKTMLFILDIFPHCISDMNFVNDFSSVVTDPLFNKDTYRKLINSVVCEHLLRQGMLDIAENLLADAGVEINITDKEPFIELHRILEALKRRDLQPALRWAALNRELLHAQNSSLEFKLLRLHFIDLVSQGAYKQTEVLLFARGFAPFARSHAKDLQELMGSLLFMRQGISNSPYSHLLSPSHWTDICDVFTRDACTLLGLSVESPLSVVIRAGCTALPPLLNIKAVMQQRQCSGVWSTKDELPVEIDLGQDCRYHSVFACPILRQQSTENNPPVRLVCGHVISRDALHKLANGNKVKCPYCPMEQSPADTKQIFF